MYDLTLAEYRALAELRYQLRCFLRFSEEAARKAGLEPHQHQLLLAVRGLPAEARPTIGVLAERLQIKPHTAVELVNRLVEGGYVERRQGASDRREVLIKLTPKGQSVLRELTLFHKAELLSDGPTLINALEGVLHKDRNKKKPRGT
jgi:DNA-binding MarR family transcriptional regulator